MNRDTQLKVQAYLDNELSAGDARSVSKLISSDAEVRDLYTELKNTKDVLVDNEPAVSVPDTRDFYWSQIQRRIASAERQPAVAQARPWWLRMLAPAAGTVALFALLVTVVNKDGQPTAVTSKLPALTAAAAPHQLEQSADVSTITFRSETEGVTVVWITSE
jgi:anti-sigma factor RsiW